jgi:serine/threonine protein kinase
MERYCYRCEKDVELSTDPKSNAQLCSICGAVIIHSTNYLPPGTMLGGFRIVGELGRGGMGIVYRARQLNLERDVALKVLADDLADDLEFVERFFKEARAAASLNHPNIVQVFDAGRSPEGISFFAMELIEGETLESHIEKAGQLSPKEALKVAVKIAGALDYAWKSQKLTHGDIKPDNIILNNTGSAKLADLGLAKFVHDETTDDGIMATPLYAPPEVIKGEIGSIGFHSDMYSFGATLYQMLAGVPPFPDNAPEIVFRQHLQDTPPSLHSYNDKLSPELVHICEQMLEKDPDQRPESWYSVYQSLKKIREPEVSGKVFHSHMQIEKEESELESENSFFSPIIKILTSLVMLLLIAIAGVFFMKNHKKEDEKNKTIIANPEIVVEKWDKLKKEISKDAPEKALGIVKNFVNECNDNVPSDALNVLKQLEKKVAANKKQKEKQAEEQVLFNKNVAKALKLLKDTDIHSEKTSISQIGSINKTVQSILKRAASVSYLTLDSKSKKTLTDAHAKLSARLLKYRLLMEKKRNEKIAAEQESELQKAKLELAQGKADKEIQIESNGTIDNYYTALAEFKENKKLSTFKSTLLEWDKNSDVVASQYSIRVDFLTNSIIPNASNIYKLIKSKESYFEGQGLSDELCPGKLKYYIVKEFTDKGIKLVYNNAKVTLGHTIPWGSISHDNLLLMVEERLLYSEDTLTNKEKSIVLSFSLLFSPDNFSRIFKTVSTLPMREKQCWTLIEKDFKMTEKELECISLYDDLLGALTDEDFATAAKLFQELKKASEHSMFASRYANIMPDLSREIKKYTPILSAIQLINSTIKNSKKPVDIFNKSMVVYARYNASLNTLDKSILAKLRDRNRYSMSLLRKSSKVKKLSDNRIPFYYWSKEKQGASQAYLDILRKSKKLNRFPEIMEIMTLATAIDNGDWPKISSIYAAQKKKKFHFIKTAPSPVKPWLPSFLFAYGLADMQFGNGADRPAIQKLMQSLFTHNNKGSLSPLVLSLTLEYDLLTRNRSFPISVTSKYPYKTFASSPMTAKVGLLGILAAIEASASSSVASLIKKQLASVFQKNKKFYGDFYYISAAEQLIKGHPLNQTLIKKLITSKCYYSDTTSRILLAALAQYHLLNGSKFKDEDTLINAMGKNVTPLIVSGDLWRKLLLLKMGYKPYAGDIRMITDTALEDARISTTRFYPGLLMIKAGSEFMLGNYSKSDVKNYLTEYFKVSSLTSKSDIANLKIITDSNPSLLVEQLFKEHQPEKAFRYGILGIMVHCKDPVKKSKIVKVIDNYKKKLSREEYFLTKQIRNWR